MIPAKPSSASIAHPPVRPTFLGLVALWGFVAAGSMAMTSLGVSIKSGRVDFLERLVWDIGWLGWAPLTLFIFEVCRRYPIDRQRPIATIARLAAIGVGVLVLQIAFDFACNMVLGSLLRDVPFTWRNFLYICAYKGHIYYGVYWMIVGAAHAVEFHRRYRETELVSSQLETKLANAELDRLKTQLQPHFLFNAHNTIVSLMLKQQNDAAIRMLTRLSDLLRASLSRSGQQAVTLREELETLRLYLEIQRERFRDRLTITVEASNGLDEAEIPHLLLQPLVENAFHHGLEDVTENGRLEVSVKRDGDALVCTVRDNGAGFGNDCTKRAQGNLTGGIGLGNTRERLQQLYGRQQSLTIESQSGAGCVVTIRIPYRIAIVREAAVTV